MVTYYVKKDEVYKVSATVDCVAYDSTSREIASCVAGGIMIFNAPTTKITLSDDNAVISSMSEVSGDLSGLTEHVNTHGIHTTSNEKSRWDTTTTNLIDVKERIPNLEAHVEDEIIHVTSVERQTWNGKANSTHTHAVSDITNLQTTLDGKADDAHNHAISDVTNLQTTLNGKANSTHTHAISDITDLQTTLDGKASASTLNALDVGVKRIDYGSGNGEGVRVYTNSSGQLSNSSGYSDYREYTATKDVCLIYYVSNAPNEGYTSDFDNISYNYPIKIWMNVKVNGSYRLSYATYRRICTGGLDFIEVHLKAGDEVQFCAASVSTFSGNVSIRLMEFNYR